MKKFNWGTGIALFYGFFAVIMVGLVIKSTFNPVLMVKKDYYDDDINFQSHYDKAQNGKQLANDMTIQYLAESNTVLLQFPPNLPTPVGKVTFFRPSENNKDRIFELKTDPSKRMMIQVDDLEKGVWRVQAEWQAEDKLYYKEEKIYIDNNNLARPVHK
jgi:nitrogen fixation protein FixH